MLDAEDREGQFRKLVEGLANARGAGDRLTLLYRGGSSNAEEQAKNLLQDFRVRGFKGQVISWMVLIS